MCSWTSTPTTGDTVTINEQGIDGANVAGHRIDVIQKGNHCLFMGDCHADPANTERPKAIHGTGDINHFKGDICLIQAAGLKGSIMHRRAQAVAYRVSHDAVEFGFPVNIMRKPAQNSLLECLIHC